MRRPHRALPALLPALLLAPAFAQEAPPAPAPAAPAAPPAAERTKGLLDVASAEATRTAALMRERIVKALRDFSTQREASADKGARFLKIVVELGPDAVPQLIEALHEVDRGSFDAAFAIAASRALVGIYERTHAESILKSLGDEVRGAGMAVKLGALEGLEQLDHPRVVEIVAPLVEAEDATLRTRAIRVLGRQKSSADAVAGTLRAQLSRQGAPIAETIRALQRLGDKSALDAAGGLAAKNDDAAIVTAAVRYLGELGGKTAVPALRTLLLRTPSPFQDPLLKEAVNAVQQIGLRDSDAKVAAEDLLLEVFRKLHDTHEPIAVHARLQLAPFANAEALKSIEDEIQDQIKLHVKQKQSNLGSYLELAEARLRFGAWSKAMTALASAKDEDNRQMRDDDINALKAVAQCGLQKYQNAEKLMQNVLPARRIELRANYPVLEKLAEKYPDLFSQQ